MANTNKQSIGNIPVIDLNTVGFNPAVFTPIEYKPKEYDVQPLIHAMDKIESRMNKASEQKGAIDSVFGQIQSKVVDTPEILDKLNVVKDKYKQQIQSQIDSGNYGAAIRLGSELAGGIMDDPEVKGMIKISDEYTKADDKTKSRIGKDINQETYDWWKDTQIKPEIKPIYRTDINGNATDQITGYESINTREPLSRIDFNQELATAAALVKPSTKSREWQNPTRGSRAQYDAKGNEVPTGTEYYEGTSSGHNQTTEVTKDDIIEQFKVNANNTYFIDRLYQEYQVDKWRYQQIVKQANDNPENKEYQDLKLLYQNTVYKNGDTSTDTVVNKDDFSGLQEYYAKKMEDAATKAKGLSYIQLSTSKKETQVGVAPTGDKSNQNDGLYNFNSGLSGYRNGYTTESGPRVYGSGQGWGPQATNIEEYDANKFFTFKSK